VLTIHFSRERPERLNDNVATLFLVWFSFNDQ